jgi:ankyrin repeat protein
LRLFSANKKKMEQVLALRDRKGNTVLHLACAYGFKELVDYLLQLGADPSIQNTSMADQFRDEVVVELGSSFKKKKKKGKDKGEDPPVAPRSTKPKAVFGEEEVGLKTPFHVCCEVGHTHIFKMFVAKGVDTSTRDECGHTCLHYAAMSNDAEIATLQLDNTRSSSGMYKAEPKSKSGWTPLHFAAMHDSVHVIVLLLDAKASPATTNKDGKTPLDLATRERTRMALAGQLKQVLKNEKREKEARLRALVDERKKKMIEVEKQVLLMLLQEPPSPPM